MLEYLIVAVIGFITLLLVCCIIFLLWKRNKEKNMVDIKIQNNMNNQNIVMNYESDVKNNYPLSQMTINDIHITKEKESNINEINNITPGDLVFNYQVNAAKHVSYYIDNNKLESERTQNEGKTRYDNTNEMHENINEFQNETNYNNVVTIGKYDDDINEIQLVQTQTNYNPYKSKEWHE